MGEQIQDAEEEIEEWFATVLARKEFKALRGEKGIKTRAEKEQEVLRRLGVPGGAQGPTESRENQPGPVAGRDALVPEGT